LTLPVLLVAYDYCFRKDFSFYALVRRYSPYAVVAVIYLILRTYAVGGFAPVKFHAYLSNYEYFINVFPLFVQYLGKLIIPANLSAAYTFHPINSLLEWRGLMAVVLTVGFVCALYLLRDRNNAALFCLLLIAIPLLPVLYIPGLGEHTFADRYLYLPSVGFAIILSMGLGSISNLDILDRRGYFVLALVLAIAVSYSLSTIKRNTVWKDDLTLWSETVRKSPDSHVVHDNLGVAYYKQGQLDEAMEEFRIALKLKPDYEKTHNNLGVVYDKLGRTDEAIEEFLTALKLKPDFAEAHYNLGTAYNVRGRIDEAIDEYKEAIRLKPDYANAHSNLGIAYGKKGFLDMAIQEFLTAIRFKTDFAGAHFNLGLAYMRKGLRDEAIKEFEAVLNSRPDDARARTILESLKTR
jgi:tetratricopeptide (TPR) repeat protein